MKIDKRLKEKYDSLYSDKTEQWRKIGAVGKVKNIVEISKGHKFENCIEIGAGDGNILLALSHANFCKSYTALEISTSAIEQIKKKEIRNLAQIVQFDGYVLPFKDKEFDVAICSHVIEHVEFPRLLLREIKRISKHQIFEIPIDYSFNVDKKASHFLSYGHINIFTPALFNFLIISEGFNIIEKKYKMYHRDVLKFNYKKLSFRYIMNRLKTTIWRILPLLVRLKPNTYTVLTNDQ
jgi:ubiquinone/menaquinone biosynthesis C-methylase UbiE